MLACSLFISFHKDQEWPTKSWKYYYFYYYCIFYLILINKIIIIIIKVVTGKFFVFLLRINGIIIKKTINSLTPVCIIKPTKNRSSIFFAIKTGFSYNNQSLKSRKIFPYQSHSCAWNFLLTINKKYIWKKLWMMWWIWFCRFKCW